MDSCSPRFGLRRSRLWRLSLTLLSVVCAVSAAESPSADDVLKDAVATDFVVMRDGERLNVRLLEPRRLSSQPLLLLNFATDRHQSLEDPLYGAPVRMFLAKGHRALSFDVPAHGERIDRHGQGIHGLCAAFLAGDDPFVRFVGDGRAVIDECIRRGWTEPGRVVVCGNSRSAYQALRLAAADNRIGAVAGLAPVTDWRFLSEFAAVKDRPEVAALALDQFADQLAGRRIYLAIGNGDRRVGSEACARLVAAIYAYEASHPPAHYGLKAVFADDSPAHTLADRWSDEATTFLMTAAP